MTLENSEQEGQGRLFHTAVLYAERDARGANNQVSSYLFAPPMSVGGVSNLDGEMTQALAPAAAEALAFIQNEEAVNAEETGFVQGREECRVGGAPSHWGTSRSRLQSKEASMNEAECCRVV